MTPRLASDERSRDLAIAWHQSLNGEDADWDVYVAWLEADPQHRKAFDAVALLDRMVDDRASDLRDMTDRVPSADVPRRRRVWLYGSIVAGISAVVATGILLPTRSFPAADAVYATAINETRRVVLAHGTSIDLAPSSRLIAVGGDATRLELLRGDVVFAVRHDPDRRLSIQAGPYRVTDIGTTFGMSLLPDSVRIAVAEGDVTVAAGEGASTRVAAGQQFVARPSNFTKRVDAFATADVGSWRQGRLVYDDTPLPVVAADLTRYSGRAVTVDPGIEQRRFSGVLVVGDNASVFDNLAALLAISYEAHGSRVRLFDPARP